MTLRAMRFQEIRAAPIRSAVSIHARCHSLKMIGIDATTVPAQVVNVQTISHWSNMMDV
jgi:hypothetical protein